MTSAWPAAAASISAVQCSSSLTTTTKAKAYNTCIAPQADKGVRKNTGRKWRIERGLGGGKGKWGRRRKERGKEVELYIVSLFC